MMQAEAKRSNSGVANDPRERATRASPETLGVGTGEITTSKEPRNSKPPVGVIAGSGPGGSKPANWHSALDDKMGTWGAHGTVGKERRRHKYIVHTDSFPRVAPVCVAPSAHAENETTEKEDNNETRAMPDTTNVSVSKKKLKPMVIRNRVQNCVEAVLCCSVLSCDNVRRLQACALE